MKKDNQIHIFSMGHMLPQLVRARMIKALEKELRLCFADDADFDANVFFVNGWQSLIEFSGGPWVDSINFLPGEFDDLMCMAGSGYPDVRLCAHFHKYGGCDLNIGTDCPGNDAEPACHSLLGD